MPQVKLSQNNWTPVYRVPSQFTRPSSFLSNIHDFVVKSNGLDKNLGIFQGIRILQRINPLKKVIIIVIIIVLIDDMLFTFY